MCYKKVKKLWENWTVKWSSVSPLVMQLRRRSFIKDIVGAVISKGLPFPQCWWVG